MPTLTHTTTCQLTQPLATLKVLPNPPYVLQLAPLSSQQSLSWAYSTSDSNQVHILKHHPSSSNLEQGPTLTTPNAGEGRVTQLKAPTGTTNCLIAAFSCSPMVALWDLRQASSDPTLQLRGATDSPFLTCDLSASGHILACGGGTEQESRLELFDLRASPVQPLHAYTESHSDLVTAIAFHPSVDHRLLSGSADGLLATYDVRLVDEDEAVIVTGNVGASVARVRWATDGQSVWAGTDMETLSVWKAEDLGLIQDFGDIRSGDLAKPHPSWTDPMAYLIDCTPLPAFQSGYFSGSQTGEVALIEASSNQPWRLLASLRGGHNDIVRCAMIDERTGMLLTGGEDGRICLWPNVFGQDIQLMSETSESRAQPKASTKKEARYKPY
ncbi:hypothetical protein CROQUDRAFT_44450 [Cronartium quercuum f. sp. fusiforme G11]|uniref:WD40 repeat-like protein n=1 Tax=Cronartium quercuum f. sp. fusiforme G11 TaxID=708437 RepID=A0A9P6TD85_9BASI|nr:hypothetical protein CROQUDRAFT_44450 [Cronartium quercuum f. sp. fusiforme G11]